LIKLAEFFILLFQMGARTEYGKKTTHFIVDSYHYINHQTDDYLCRKWCNPAPLNGSAPNLVIAATDNQG